MPNLFTDYIHLGKGATAGIEPPFMGMQWYADYMQRHEADGFEGRLVSFYTFTENWDSWECHPHGHEVVICTAGKMTLHQEMADGITTSVTIGPGEYAINPPGAWHTADIHGDEATALFITAGWGTDHRPR